MRIIRFLVVMACLFALPAISYGQGFLDLSYFSSVQIKPTAKIGYQRLGLNMDVPVAEGIAQPSRLAFNPFNIKLDDTDMWVGSVGFDISSGPNWGLLLEASANARKNAIVRVGEIGNLYGNRARLWTGSQMEWWALDGAVFYNVYGASGLLLGGKVDHTSLKLADPRLRDGTPVSDPRIFAFSGDVQSKLYALLLGLKIGGPNLLGTLTCAPIAWVDIEIPFDAVWINDALTRNTYDQVKYSLKKSGYMLEASGQFDTTVWYGLNLGFWAKANFTRIRGAGNEAVTARRIINATGALQSSIDASESAPASFARYLIAFGVNAAMPF